MIPFLTYPLALLALASVPALAAIYLLRNRFRRRRVSSLVLWRFQVQSKAGGAKIHRLQLPPLFFLELLALVLLVAAAAGPHWQLPQLRRPLIVVLDDSFSMRAVHDGVSAQTRAQDFLQALFQRQAPPSTRLILAGTDTRSLGATIKSWSEVTALLAQWQCRAPAAAINSAITLAAGLGKQTANILVLTDHPPADKKISNQRLEWHAFGLPLDNFAIVSASRTAFGEQDRCLLEIANFSSQPQATTLSVRTGSNTVQRTKISTGAHENQRLVFNLPATTPRLDASLEADALADDNQVQLLPPIRKRLRVQVALASESMAALANRTLDATGLRAAISTDPELVIHDTDSPVGSNTWSFVWSNAAATNTYASPFIIDGSQPAVAGVALEGVVWAAAALTNSPGYVPLILAGNTPLFSARTDALGRRRLSLNFNPELSTVQNTPDWPILFWNLLNWRAAELPGLKESNVRLGAEVSLKTTGGPVTVTRPDGGQTSFPKTGDELALETPLPGIYSVSMDARTNQFVVNTLAADESDLSACVTGHWGVWAEDTARRLEETSTAWLFGLLALACLTTHSYLVATAKGGR